MHKMNDEFQHTNNANILVVLKNLDHARMICDRLRQETLNKTELTGTERIYTLASFVYATAVVRFAQDEELFNNEYLQNMLLEFISSMQDASRNRVMWAVLSLVHDLEKNHASLEEARKLMREM